MKSNRRIYIAAVVAALSVGSSTHGEPAGDIMIGLSPYQAPGDAKAIRRQVTEFILEGTPGRTVSVQDAYALKEVAVFQIPRLRFDSPEVRGQKLMEPFTKLAKWYELTGQSSVGVPLKGSGALRIPEFLATLAQRPLGPPYSVLLIGNPMTLSMEEPGFSMVGNRVPSDAHLLTNTATSIYGTSDKNAALSGCTVHVCYLNEGIWPNQLLRTSVQRFWGLYMSRQGGLLADFTGDMSRAFASMTQQRDRPHAELYQLDPSDSNLEMRVVSERRVPVREPQKVTVAAVRVVTNTPVIPVSITVTATVVKVHTVYVTNTLVREVKVVEIPAVAVVTNVPVATNTPPIPVAPTGRIGIAAWWAADADVDLYVSVTGQRDLCFENTTNKAGKYHRDIRVANSPTTEDAWRDQLEYVELLENTRIVDVRCWLNLYRVNQRAAQPVTGKVRIQHADGHFVESPFMFTVTRGNEGADLRNRQSSAYWIPIDLTAAGTHP